MRTNFLFLLVAFILCGCATSESYQPQSGRKQIDVVTLSDIHREYTILGEVHTGVIFGGIRNGIKEATKMGADAVTLPERNNMGETMSYAIKYKN